MLSNTFQVYVKSIESIPLLLSKHLTIFINKKVINSVINKIELHFVDNKNNKTYLISILEIN